MAPHTHRLSFLRQAAGILFLLVFHIAAAKAESPPNILFIAIDDLKTIGSLYSEEPGDFLQRIYPEKNLRMEVAKRMTPNIQRLADEGVAFMRAYCAAPACNPSRAALMTGIRPHRTGLTTNAGAVFFREFEYEGQRPLAEATALPELLQRHGWYTAETGKIYHSGSNFEKSDGHRSWTDWTDVGGNAGPKTRSPWSPESLNWGQEGGDAASFVSLNDYRKADFIASVLENGSAVDGDTTFALAEEGPFFLACGIFRPHLPYYATKDLLDLFPVEEMTVNEALLDLYTQDGDDIPEFAFGWSGLSRDESNLPIIGNDRFVDILTHGNTVDPQGGDLQGWRDMLAHYFASSAIADRAVGRLLDGLENSPYKDNTVVILWSDHGYHLGEKLHQTKFTLWDAGARVNFIIKDPRRSQSVGIRCYRPVTLIDIYPTVAAMAGLPLPDERITGHDLSPLLDDPRAAWNIPAHTTYQDVSNNMVRMEKYKLIQYKDGPTVRELYDMEDDPEEFQNLAGNSEYGEIESSMEAILSVALQEGAFPEEGEMSAENWRYGYWGFTAAASPAGDSDDPDQDGLDNFSEYIFATNPLEFDFDPPPYPRIDTSRKLAYEFLFRPGQENLRFELISSANLVDWNASWDSFVHYPSFMEEVNTDGTELISIPFADQPVTPVFFQLRVSKN